MYKRIPKDFIRDLIDRVNIVDYVSQYSELKRVGQKGEMATKCPLPNHKDDTPSFYVNDHKQSYKCHGCGSGGGIIDFLKDMHGYEFIPAIEELADFLNLKIPYESSQKGDFISYSEIYKEIYASAKSECNNNCDLKLKGIDTETAELVGLVSVRPSLIRKKCKDAFKDKPEMYANVIQNLPDTEELLTMLPIRTQFSDSIECLYLIDNDSSYVLPNKPARGYDKLTYNSHRYSSNSPKKSVHLLTDPIKALRLQSHLENDEAVIATVDEPINLNKRALKPFIDKDGFLLPENLVIHVYFDEANVQELLEHYLRISSSFAARTEFRFYTSRDSSLNDFIVMDYQELFNTVLENKFKDFSQPEFARFVEYLLGGDKLKSNLMNSIRYQAYESFGKSAKYQEHFEYEYIKPSSHIMFERLAVKDDELLAIKDMVNNIINMSMDVTPNELKNYIKELKGTINPDKDNLRKICLDKLDLLSSKDGFIRIDKFIDTLSADEKDAYFNESSNSNMNLI